MQEVRLFLRQLICRRRLNAWQVRFDGEAAMSKKWHIMTLYHKFNRCDLSRRVCCQVPIFPAPSPVCLRRLISGHKSGFPAGLGEKATIERWTPG